MLLAHSSSEAGLSHARVWSCPSRSRYRKHVLRRWRRRQLVDLVGVGHFERGLAAVFDDPTEHGYLRRLWRERVVENRLADLIEPHRVAELEIDSDQRLVQTDIDLLHPTNLSHCHAHGVGAYRSIHTEGFERDVPELGTRRNACQEQSESDNDGSEN